MILSEVATGPSAVARPGKQEQAGAVAVAHCAGNPRPADCCSVAVFVVVLLHPPACAASHNYLALVPPISSHGASDVGGREASVKK